MGMKTYRISALVPVFGVVGALFFAYMLLYSVGVITWKMFPRMQDLSAADDPEVLCLFAVVGVGCIFSIWIGRVRVTSDDTGIVYVGPVRSVKVRWADITRVLDHRGGPYFHVWTEDKHVAIWSLSSMDSEMRASIIARVKEHTPTALIEEGRPEFWPRRQKGWPRSRNLGDGSGT